MFGNILGTVGAILGISLRPLEERAKLLGIARILPRSPRGLLEAARAARSAVRSLTEVTRSSDLYI